MPWPALAAIGALESDHGRSRAPGVRSGVNRHGCCAGSMQCNTRDGPPSTWEHYGVDGNDDGSKDIYDPEDATPSAAHYLQVLLRHAYGNLSRAVRGYNLSPAYVSDVLARARAYAGAADEQLATAVGEPTALAGCAGSGLDASAGPANLREAQRVAEPRAFRTLPSWALTGVNAASAVDARLFDDVVWILRRYRLRVSAAPRSRAPHPRRRHRRRPHPRRREHPGGLGRLHRTPRPRPRLDWRLRARRHAARMPTRAGRPVHRLRRLPRPRFAAACTGGCPAHLHLSWASPCYGTSRLSAPCEWVMAFAVLPADYPAAARPAP